MGFAPTARVRIPREQGVMNEDNACRVEWMRVTMGSGEQQEFEMADRNVSAMATTTHRQGDVRERRGRGGRDAEVGDDDRCSQAEEGLGR